MNPAIETTPHVLLVLGTGGTIAGSGVGAGAASLEYVAGTVGVAELVRGADAPSGFVFHAEQVAQIDSKDMTLSIWRDLADRCATALTDNSVGGIIITHGTDTIEETAFFLASVFPSLTKPIVLTCAMRPATALSPDGPQNLRDAVAVAVASGISGVFVVCAGEIHDASYVRKSHPYRLNAFESGELGPVGYVEEGNPRLTRPATNAGNSSCNWKLISSIDIADWPSVEIVTSFAGTRGRLVDILTRERESGAPNAVDGLILAATGNGSLHEDLIAAALRAQTAGIEVWRASRCLNGTIVPTSRDRFPHAGTLTPVKARIALLLRLLTERSVAKSRQPA
ncbi:asparaginase [Paraburkholderia susongensis]|uniref:L-asparaginase n=1 Tax=Paraburkholderia susongensis TaxID=1515439 RepID=A0A1X7M1P2_9BURK|nr:asparaginase [Paraburkholderia susongensis]SMG59637.1 L-asparaginase [Paraburkholderia susongensis]